jgi:hypothetical protein
MWCCPRCGGNIRVFDASAAVIVCDDGVEQDSGFEWEEDAKAECTDCEWKGIAADAFEEEVA